MVEGRASLAKQGISVEQSSTFVEPSSDNQITLEIFNASDADVDLAAGQVIAKLFILKVVEDI
jgi:deoxycytidine triphosphate deaminase